MSHMTAISLVLALLLGGREAQKPPASKPATDIPAFTNLAAATRYADYVRGRRAWETAWMTNAYGRVGQQNPAWDAQVLTAIVAYAEQINPISYPSSAANRRRLITASRQAYARGCRDPFLLLVRGDALLLDGQVKASQAMIGESVGNLATSAYPRTLSFLANRHLAQIALQMYRASATQRAIQALVEAANDDIYQPAQQGYFADLPEFAWDNVGNWGLFAGPIARQTFRDPWIEDYLNGIHHGYVFAMENRRYNPAAPREGGIDPETMHHWLKATVALGRAHRLRPDWPHAATAMIRLATIKPEPPDTAAVWFDRAISRCADWPAAYTAIANPPGCTPLFEKAENTERLVRACMDTHHATRDTAPAFLYALHMHRRWGVPPLDRLLKSPANWRATREALRANVANAALDDAERANNRELLIAAAWRAGDFDEAARASGGATTPVGYAVASQFHLDWREVNGLLEVAQARFGAPLQLALTNFLMSGCSDALPPLIAAASNAALSPLARSGLRVLLEGEPLRGGHPVAADQVRFMVEEGRREWVWREWQQVVQIKKVEDPALRAVVAEALGPVAMAAAGLPALDDHQTLDPGTLSNAMAQVRAQLADVTGETPLDAAGIQLAELRWWLYGDTRDSGAPADQEIGKRLATTEVMARYAAIKQPGAFLDLLLEQGDRFWNLRISFIGHSVKNRYLWRQLQLAQQVDTELALVANLAREAEVDRLVRACRQAFALRESLSFSLRLAQLLRQRGAIVEAERFEAWTDRFVTFLTYRSVREMRAPEPGRLELIPGGCGADYYGLFCEDTLALYNIVPGYEREALEQYDAIPYLSSILLIRDRALPHLLAAEAALRLGDLTLAGELLERGTNRPSSNAANFVTAGGHFKSESEYRDALTLRYTQARAARSGESP